MAELEELHLQGWRGPVFVVDDNFIGNKRTVKKDLLPVLIAWQKALNFVFRFSRKRVSTWLRIPTCCQP